LCPALLLFFLNLNISLGKMRSWIGPTQLIQGTPPIPRDSFGITTASDEKVYIYGGIGDIIGEHRIFDSISNP
jgi:hypothetical protein